MSGGTIPYHLRVNKYVDRQLFMECLDIIFKWKGASHYGYATLGGPFLADLKAVHARFRLQNLLSIEADSSVYLRQTFNKPISLIDCEKMETGDFVTNYDSITAKYDCDNWAIWLDYVAPGKREQQLGEVAALAAKLGAGDVLRVTLNAALHTLAHRESFDNLTDFQNEAFTRARSNLGRYFPGDRSFSSEDMTAKGVAELLLSAVRVAVLEGLAGDLRLRIVPICAFRYTDGLHQMLTVTMVLAEMGDNFETETKINEWPYFSGGWEGVKEILVPDLSVKERIALDELLFRHNTDEICKIIPFKLDSSNGTTKKLVSSYAEHYLRYPSFLQVLM